MRYQACICVSAVWRCGKSFRRCYMIYDLQKASIGKRISAFILDVILFAILAVGAAAIVSEALNYDYYADRLEQIQAECFVEQVGEDYKDRGIMPGITEAEYNELSAADRLLYDKAQRAFATNKEANEVYSKLLSYVFLITNLGTFISCIVLEFVVPLFLRNGQTVGKKVFGIGVMLKNGVRINSVALFSRSMLGKFAIETALPMLAVTMLFLGTSNLLMLAVAILVIVLNVGLLLFHRENTVIHDIVSYTVCVDLASQMIFDNEAAMIEYKNRVHQEANELDTYRY